MKKNKITSLEYSTITFFLVNSFLMNVGFNTLTSKSKTDSILDILLGGILILAFSFLVFNFQRKEKDSIITIINKKMPLFIKIMINILLIIIIGYASIYTLTNTTNFIHYYILKEVSSIIIMITLILTVTYITYKGIATIGKTSEMFFYVYFLIFIVSAIGLIKYMDLSNLKPLFTTNIQSHMTTSSNYFLSCIIPLFLLLGISPSQVEWENKNKHLPYLFTLLSILFTFITLILIISILGIKLANIYKFPDIIIYKKISFLNLLERIEVILAFNNLLNSIFFLIMGTYFLKEVLFQIGKKKKEHIILALIDIIFLLVGNFLVTNITFYLFLNLLFLWILIFLVITYYLHKYILPS